jgi:translation initiation factor 2-alpha kinase 4
MAALFKPPTASEMIDNRVEDYTYDIGPSTNQFDGMGVSAISNDPSLELWTGVVINRLTSLLQRHGAVETHLPFFLPETTLLSAFADRTPVRVLDTNGKMVQMPNNGLLRMARHATRRRIDRIKRYWIGERYSAEPFGGQPIVSRQIWYVSCCVVSCGAVLVQPRPY